MVAATPNTLEDIQHTRDMVDAGDTQIADIEQRVQALSVQIAEDNATITTLVTALDAKHEQVEQALASVTALDAKHKEAVSYAKLATKKPNEQRAVSALTLAKKELDVARKELERIEREYKEASELHNARLSELHKSIHEASQEQDALRKKIAALTPGRDKAKAELGHMLSQYVSEQVAAKQEAIDALHNDMVHLQADVHAFLIDSQEQLSAWPNLQREARNLETPDTSLLRLLDSALLYVTSALDECLDVNQEAAKNMPALPVLRIPNTNVYDAWLPLLVHPDEVVNAYRKHPAQLEKRRDQLTQMRVEYLSYLKEAK